MKRAKKYVRVPRKAASTFKRWHGFDADEVVQLKGPGKRIPDTLVALGELVEIVYRSNKWDGEPKLYRHKTSKPHPMLATDPTGRALYLVGGRVKVTARGLVN